MLERYLGVQKENILTTLASWRKWLLSENWLEKQEYLMDRKERAYQANKDLMGAKGNNPGLIWWSETNLGFFKLLITRSFKNLHCSQVHTKCYIIPEIYFPQISFCPLSQFFVLFFFWSLLSGFPNEDCKITSTKSPDYPFFFLQISPWYSIYLLI